MWQVQERVCNSRGNPPREDHPEPHRILSLSDAAKIAGVSKRTIESWAYRGWINRYKGGYYYPEITRYLDILGSCQRCGSFIDQPKRGRKRTLCTACR